MWRVFTVINVFKWLYKIVGGQRKQQTTNVIYLLNYLAYTKFISCFFCF